MHPDCRNDSKLKFAKVSVGVAYLRKGAYSIGTVTIVMATMEPHSILFSNNGKAKRDNRW